MIDKLRWKLISWLLPKSTLEIGHTERGFAYYKFKDSNQEDCCLQKSSTAMTDRIWLGASKLCVQKFHPNSNEPWTYVDFSDGEYVGNERMHLDQHQVAMLLPYLIGFVVTGEL